MSAVKTLALGILVLGAIAPTADAAPMRRGWWRRAAAATAAESLPPTFPWSFYLWPPATSYPSPASTWSIFALPAMPAVPAPSAPAPVAVAAPPPPQALSVVSGDNGLFRVASTATASAAPPPAMAVHVASAGSAPAAPAYAADASINFNSTSLAGLGGLATGNPQPWYLSPSVTQVYHGVPSADQQNAFTAAVLQHVQQTFQQSGVPVTLTLDQAVPAAHSLSVVSGVSSPSNPDAIGLTSVGYDGLSFIDKLKYGQSPDELEWVVAHNVAHELMHAFGGEHHDTTGQYLDAAVSPWNVLADPNTVFSADSVKELLSHDFRNRGEGVYGTDGGQLLAPVSATVPEPATLALWASAGALAFATRLRGRRRAA